METRRPWVSVAETATYAAQADKLLTDQERQAVVDLLTVNPEIGDVIQETGGARKVRIALQGRGKRGGGRVVYFFHGEEIPLFLLSVYAKNRKADLSAKEKAAIHAFCKAIVADAKRRKER